METVIFLFVICSKARWKVSSFRSFFTGGIISWQIFVERRWEFLQNLFRTNYLLKKLSSKQIDLNKASKLRVDRFTFLL